MNNTDVLKLLQNIHEKNLCILNKQKEASINFNSSFYKLYHSYWLSNEKLKTVIDLLEIVIKNKEN
ncbi:hypothetical protein [Bacillus inaquosorum]|uniref:hypothetical protein n=1 Tax=Bacillus inaquosorum TaxID=483913 RepID=UPI00228247CC|nr:hypothetical protein [Bacillus inaquosorum]MCY8147027.1 hypothetical protein [Bacillus inaquosorum]